MAILIAQKCSTGANSLNLIIKLKQKERDRIDLALFLLLILASQLANQITRRSRKKLAVAWTVAIRRARLE
jgi:hypothetical protein